MSDRLFRALLRLLPEEFRSAYARDMEATFRAERHEAGSRRPLRLWAETIADVLRHAPVVHLDILRRDARLAVRTLTARPLALAVAILTLAIGLGANVAMYAVVDTVLLSPLPYANAEALMMVSETDGDGDASNLGYLTFADLRARARSFSTLIAASQSTATLTAPDQDAERVNAMRVSQGYFEMLGVAPALGRTFLESEDQPGDARRVVILSDRLWRRRFGARPDAVGAALNISGIELRVVGVLPADFDDLVASRMYNGAEIWYPLGYDPVASFACRTCRHLRVFGRLASGVPPERAATELNDLFAALEREHPTQYRQAGARVTPLTDVFLGPVRPVILALWAGVGVLLLVACGNVAHLLLLRASERTQEVAVRAALGVTRARLVRQFLTEALILAATGGLVGLGLAWAIVHVVAAVGPAQIPRLADVALGTRAIVGAGLLTFLSGLAFGVAPLNQLLRHGNAAALRSGARGTDSQSTWRTRAVLVGANVAMATVLLVGSGLLVRSLSGLLSIAPGLAPDGVLTLQIWATGERFRAGETADQVAAGVQFYDAVLDQIRALPGVSHAAATTTLPLGGNVDGYSVHVLSREAPSGQAPAADRFTVTPEYFDALRIPLVQGRHLNSRDDQRGEHVAVIGATAAATLFPGQDPLGQQLTLGPRTAQARTIVGIVGDVRHQGLDVAVGSQVYVPQAQWAWAETFMTVVIRTTGNPMAMAGAVRESVRRVDPAQPVTNLRPYADVIAATTGARRFAATLLAAFAITSTVMVIIGLYGSVAVLVAQRRREIGVRIALGASAAGIRALVFSQGLRPVLVGLVAGLGLAAVSVPALDSMLYGMDPLDPATFSGTAVVLGFVAVVACLGPARRAGRIDPATAVRD